MGSLSVAENMGDVNEELPHLCQVLGLPAPLWCDGCGRYFMAWRVDEHRQETAEEGDEHEPGPYE